MGGYQCRFLAISCGPCSFIPSSFQGALHSLKRMHLSISRIVSVKRGWVTSLRVRAHSPHPAPARSEQQSARSTLPWLLVAATERCGGTLSGYTVLGAGQLLRHLPPPPPWFRNEAGAEWWLRAWDEKGPGLLSGAPSALVGLLVVVLAAEQSWRRVVGAAVALAVAPAAIITLGAATRRISFSREDGLKGLRIRGRRQ